MKKFLLIILLFSKTILLQSQEYFNFRFDYTGTGVWNGATNVYVMDNGYIAGGTTGTTIDNPWPRAGLFKTDLTGNKVFSKIYGDTISQYYFGNPGSINKLNESTVIIAGTRRGYTSNWVHDEGLLYFFNNDFDTLFTRKYGEKALPFDTSYIFNQGRIFNDKIIVSGTRMPQPGPEKVLLMKTDGQGNQLWEKTYWDGTFNQGHSVTGTSDGGYAIGGFSWEPLPPPNLTGDPIVIKTDSAGNHQWFHNYGTPFIDSRGMICGTTDGNMILGFGYCDSMSGGGPSTEGNPYRRINLIKLDNLGNIIWNQKYGRSEYEKTLLNIRENFDGTIISTGITHHSKEFTSKDFGWILKTASNGDSIWYREYSVCSGEDSDNWLYDVIETPDLGYLACGVVYPQEPDTGSQDGWILKVDSLGCENPDYCWVGMKPEPLLPENTILEIYPNPAQEEITIEIQPSTSLQPAILNLQRIKLRLYDLFGREVKTVELFPDQTRYRLDVSELPEGLYLAAIESDGQVIARKKVMKHAR